MKKSLLILWLRFWAYVLDSVGRKHSIRRRLGQLQRVRKGICVAPAATQEASQ